MVRKKPLKTIYPKFDPDTGTWFLTDRKTEAPTLRELLEKLGNKYKVQNYYPASEKPISKGLR